MVLHLKTVSLMHLALAILLLAPLHAQIIVPSLGLLPCYPPSRTVAVLLNSRMKFLQMVQFRLSCQWMLLLHVVCFYAAFSFIYAFRLDSTFTTTFLGLIDLALTLCTLSRIFSFENIFFMFQSNEDFFAILEPATFLFFCDPAHHFCHLQLRQRCLCSIPCRGLRWRSQCQNHWLGHRRNVQVALLDGSKQLGFNLGNARFFPNFTRQRHMWHWKKFHLGFTKIVNSQIKRFSAYPSYVKRNHSASECS